MAYLGTPINLGLDSVVHDPYGTGRIIDWNDKLSGTISLDGSPAIMRVFVVSRSSDYIASTMSKIDGTWSFIALPQPMVDGNPLQIVGYDDSGADANAVIQDFVYTVA